MKNDSMKNDIHRPGRRPLNRPREFYETLQEQYKTMTTREMAALYHVSSSTISVWMKHGRDILNGN